MTTIETVEKCMRHIAPHVENMDTKVTIVGSGAVGMGVATALLIQEISKNVVLVDMDGKRVAGEVLDLQHATPFLSNSQVSGGTDYTLTKNSRVCVLTAGVRQDVGESRLGLVQRNVEVFKKIIPAIVEQSPNCVLVVVTNPCDILTYVAWKISGFPPERVFGSGCDLDSARFRALLAQKFEVAPNSVHGNIIGEHGDSSVAVWSGVNIAGLFVKDIHPAIGTEEDPERFIDVHKAVIQGAYDVIKLKGYTSWAVGYTVANIVKDILDNVYAVHMLSVNVAGLYGIKESVFLSLPTILGSKGIHEIILLMLNDEEQQKLQESAKLLWDIQKDLVF
ncbi:hypothetical protein WA026_021465 [Henosepilachna vigintioctopunctata]|uniref:L-lactate dehydrogenase n=1 Tax=Henosepilachna vigintioctopunctata TaxID=420089 RepID=A0AAW1USC6_9CUCU